MKDAISDTWSEQLEEGQALAQTLLRAANGRTIGATLYALRIVRAHYSALLSLHPNGRRILEQIEIEADRAAGAR